jgi:hypothetical protein
MSARRLGVVALALVSGCAQGTFVSLSIDQRATSPATTRLGFALMLDGRSASGSLTGSGGKAITFPTTATLQIGSGSGAMSVVATAYDAAGAVIDEAAANVDVLAGKTVPLTLTLGGGPSGGDMAVGGDGGGLPGVPGAPTNVVASSGNAQATVSWSPPASSGSGPITSYTIKSMPGAMTMTTPDGTTTAVSFTGLTNGTMYTFSVAATNASGTGPAATSNPATPTATPMVPSAPTGVAAVANVDHGATISWTASDNHGSPLQGYAVSFASQSGVLTTAGPMATSAQVTGLTPGMTYNFSVTSTNGVGSSAASFPSNNIVAATKPDAAPTSVMATANVDRGATVSWTAPATSGFSPITKYTVTASPGGATATTADGMTTNAVVTGLTAGTAYTFTVFASNIIGDGPSSSASSPVTALTVLPAPTGVFACGANGKINLSFNSVAGAQSYDVFYSTSTPATGGSKINVTASPAAITVANGSYYVAIESVNAVGDGPPSSEVTALADSQVHDTLFVAATDSAVVDTFDCASQLPSGTSSPSRTLTLAAVTGGIAVDPVDNVLFVAGNSGSLNVGIWLDATNVSGTKTPDYTMTGVSAGALALDLAHKKLYAGAGQVERYGYSAISDLATATSEATFFSPAGAGLVHQLYVNPANGDLWGAGFASGGTNGQCGAMGVWKAANTATGGGATRIYKIAGDQSCNYYGVSYLPANGGTLYSGESALWWITNIDSNAGGVTTFITPTGTLAQPVMSLSMANNLVWIMPSSSTSPGNGEVMMWNLASLSGAAVKTFSSPHTHGTNGNIVYIP